MCHIQKRENNLGFDCSSEISPGSFDPVARNRIKQDIQRPLQIRSQLCLKMIDTFGDDDSLDKGGSNPVHKTYQSNAP